MKDRIPKACKPVKPEFISSLLRSIGAEDNPKDLGISKELFRHSVIHAKEVRPRYTILQYAADIGELERIADLLTDKFYG